MENKWLEIDSNWVNKIILIETWDDVRFDDSMEGKQWRRRNLIENFVNNEGIYFYNEIQNFSDCWLLFNLRQEMLFLSEKFNLRTLSKKFRSFSVSLRKNNFEWRTLNEMWVPELRILIVVFLILSSSGMPDEKILRTLLFSRESKHI